MNATETLNTLQAELINLRNDKKVATNNHTNKLLEGINILKDLFNSVSEIKQTSEKSLIKTVQKKTELQLNNDTKRVLKISHKLINGYKVKKELLTLAQIEQLITFNKSIVNQYMSIKEDEEYIDSIKELIKNAKVERVTKVFSSKQARNYKEK